MCAPAARRSVRAWSVRADDDDESETVPTPDMFGSGTSRRSPPLHRAARWGDRARVLALLSEADAPDVDTPDRNGSTAMMWAAQFGHDDVVDALLRNGASPLARNRFGWSALEYPSTPDVAGDLVPLRLAAPGVSRGARVVVPPRMLAGAHGMLVCEHTADARRSGPPRSLARVASRVVNAARRYAESAATSARDILENPAEMVVGGVAVAGCTFKPLGLYAGQRYEIARLFWRRRGVVAATPEEEAVARIPARTVRDPEPVGPGIEPGTFEMCAELRNPTWTPWGSVEVAVRAAELRSVRDEFAWAASVAAFAASFWIGGGALLSADLVSLAAVPSESMAPGIHRGDVMLVDRRRDVAGRVAAGDVVLFKPPDAMLALAAERGAPLGRGDFFVKRVVAVEGDVVEVRAGALLVNGAREKPYPTGTPVGVWTSTSHSTSASVSVRDADSDAVLVAPPPVDCRACKVGRYDVARATVPRGFVFVLGDNRGGSVDSHAWGFLPRENVVGLVRARVAPVDRAGRLSERDAGESRVADRDRDAREKTR